MFNFKTNVTPREAFRLLQLQDEGHCPLVDAGKKGIESYDPASGVIPEIGTPWDVCEDYIDSIPSHLIENAEINIGTDIPEVVHILVKERGVNPQRINLDCDSGFKIKLAKFYKVCYSHGNDERRDIHWRDSIMKKQFDVNLINHKYTDIIHNPGKKPTPVSKSKERINNGFSYVKDGGYFGVVSTTQSLLSAGQKSVFSEFLRSTQFIKVFAEIKFPGNLGVETSGFIVKKTQPTSSDIPFRSIANEDFVINADDFIYSKTNDNYLPVNATKDSIPLLQKILKLNRDVFEFSASSSEGFKNKVAFWGGRNIALSPKHFRVTSNGHLSISETQTTHPCGLNKTYPEENVRALFQGKWFHWCLTQIIRKPGGNRPAGVSYFPIVDLNKKWTFDSFAKHIGASVKEKELVLNWASTKNEDWQD